MSHPHGNPILPRRDKRTFHTLDALRGIAAAVVLTRHAPAFFGAGLFPSSALGVDLFFIMSGFVIAHAYDRKLDGGLSTVEFLRIRLVRLYPLYLLGTVMGALVALSTVAAGVRSAQTGLHWQGPALLRSFALSLVLLPTPPVSATMDSLYPLNAVAWSLAFEVAVNVLFAATHRFWTGRAIAAVMAVSAVLLAYATVANGDIDVGWRWPTLGQGLARVSYSFPAGVLLFRLWRGGLFRVPSHAALPLVGSVCVFLVDLPRDAHLAFELAAVFVIFPVVTILSVQAETPGWLIKPSRFLGTASYAVYALHRPVLSVVNGFAQLAHVDVAGRAPLVGIPFLLLFFAGCRFVDLAYDQPLRRRFQRKRPRGAAIPWAGPRTDGLLPADASPKA